VAESWLHETVCRQRPRVCYMKLCVRQTKNVADIWLHEAVCIQRPELWVTVGYMKLCVDRDLNCG